MPEPIMADDALPDTARRFVIRGLMQGVGFRHNVRGAALASGVVGWIRNLGSGQIEVHAQGTPEQLQRFRAMLDSDSGYASRLQIGESTVPLEACAGFEIRQ
jgi:acylphosphatase